MKRLIIIGAGAFGREVFTWALQSCDSENVWSIGGFLDDRSGIASGLHPNARIIGDAQTFVPSEEDVFVCAIGEPAQKRKYCGPLIEKGGKFANVVHPSSVVGANVRLGKGVIVCPGVVLSNDVRIGSFTAVNTLCSIGHDVCIGEFCQVNPCAAIGGHAILEDNVTVGSNASVLPKAVVREGAVVGAGSVVLSQVASNKTVFGVPARVIAFPQSPKKQ